MSNIQQYNNKIKELKTKKSNVEEKILKEIETKDLKNTKFKMSNNNIFITLIHYALNANY